MNLKMRDILSVAGMTGLFAAVTLAQAPATTPKAATSPVSPQATLRITAMSANVSGAGEKIEFFINKWSTDAERDKLAAAWNTRPAPAAPAGAPAGRGGGGGRGGRGGGADAAAPAAGARNAGAPAAAAPAAGAQAPAAPAAGAPPAAAAAGRGGGGRGGRGGEAAGPRTPEAALTAALKDMPAAGYFWTSEVGGYVIKYAVRIPDAAGGSRIILVTDKRLGAAKNGWQPVPAAKANDYEFSLIELRLPAKGEGEGKASLTGTLTVDPGTKSVALEGYDALPVTLRGVQARTES